MKKFLLTMFALLFLASTSQAKVWESDPTNSNGWKAVLNATSVPTTWTATSNDLKAVWTFEYNWDNIDNKFAEPNGGVINFGSAKKPLNSFSFSTSDIPGTITKVELLEAKSNGTTTTSVTIGGATFGKSVNASTTSSTISFEGNASGEIIISTTIESKKQFTFGGIIVTYEDNAGPEDYTKKFPESISLQQGETFQLPNEAADIMYDSTDKNVATVSEEGLVTATGNGNTEIYIMWGENKDWAEGDITIPVTVVGSAEIAYDTENVSVDINEIEAFVAPTLSNPHNLEITYDSSYKTVATVDAEGHVKLTGKTGTATITATFAGNDEFGPATASYTIKAFDSNLIEVTYDFTDAEALKGWGIIPNSSTSQGVDIDGIDFKLDVINFAPSLGTASNTTKIWTKTDYSYELRIYNGAFFTISVPYGYEITKVDITGANLTKDSRSTNTEWVYKIADTKKIKSITVTCRALPLVADGKLGVETEDFDDYDYSNGNFAGLDKVNVLTLNLSLLVKGNPAENASDYNVYMNDIQVGTANETIKGFSFTQKPTFKVGKTLEDAVVVNVTGWDVIEKAEATIEPSSTEFYIGEDEKQVHVAFAYSCSASFDQMNELVYDMVATIEHNDKYRAEKGVRFHLDNVGECENKQFDISRINDLNFTVTPVFPFKVTLTTGPQQAAAREGDKPAIETANGVAKAVDKYELASAIDQTKDLSGVSDVTVEAGEAEYYNLQGVRVANPERGIYIRVAGGKATKVRL